MKLDSKDRSFMAVTAGFFFMFGPMQMTILLLTGVWQIDWESGWGGITKTHYFPLVQVLDNFVGLPALWALTWVAFAAYRRGHIDNALLELITALKKKDSNNNIN